MVIMIEESKAIRREGLLGLLIKKRGLKEKLGLK